MSVLKPYIDSKKLIVKSAQMSMEACSTPMWNGSFAQDRMATILREYYLKDKVNAVLSPYDGLSRGIIQALKGTGYGTSELPMLIITGQDAEFASIKLIISGDQRQTVWNNSEELVKKAVTMIDTILKGNKLEIDDERAYSTGAKIVPTVLVDPTSIDKTNYIRELIDSGMYKVSDIE